LEEYRNAWVLQFERVQPSDLANKLRAFKAWAAWTPLPGQAFKPQAIHVAAFLRAKAKGGPTAANAALADLKWVAARLGLAMPLNHPMVKAAAKTDPAHAPAQAEPHQLKEIAHLEVLTGSSDPYVAHVAAAAWVMASGTARFRHLQRSVPLKLTSMALAMACSRDKAVESSYLWVVPVMGLTRGDMGDLCWKSFQAAREITKSEPSFLLHDLHPKGAQPGEAQAFTGKAMSYNKYTRCLETILMMPPLSMPAEQAAAVVTYRARRWMPSVVGLMNFSEPEAASVGNWRISAEPGATKLSVHSTMHVRYDDTKVQRAAMTKAAAIFALRHAVQEANSFDIAWDDLPVFLPEVQWARQQAKGAGKGLNELLPKRTASASSGSHFSLKPAPGYSATQASRPAVLESPPLSAAGSGSSSSSSGSSSTPSESAEEEVFSDHTEDILNNLFWAAPTHKTAVLHIFKHADSDRFECLCGFHLKADTPHGKGLVSAPQTGIQWHKACLSKVPDQVRRSLSGAW